jgi:hypothetical protein
LGKKKTRYRPSVKRVLILTLFYLLFAVMESAAWTGFLLDEILFRAYRDTPVQAPVFIIGNPRSGTTFLQRLLARDRETFTCMRLWEILFAPSITQRRVLSALAKIDHRLGGPAHRLIDTMQQKWEETNAMHVSGLLTYEEDQYLLIHIWSTLVVWQFAGFFDEEARAYTHFDQSMGPEEKQRIMTFYRQAIRRHLFAHRRGAPPARRCHYLAKNPSATPKVDTLCHYFPDAKFIYLVRNPLDMIPSDISLLDCTARALGHEAEPYACRNYVLDMAEHWYTYAPARLAAAPPERAVIVNFEALVTDADQTVREIYERFGLDVSPGYAEILKEEARKARAYQSRHVYDMEKMGLTREQLVTDYHEVFERYGFDTRESKEEQR